MTVDLRDIADVESVACANDEGAPRRMYAYLRTRDGRLLLWQYELGASPGRQIVAHVEGA